MSQIKINVQQVKEINNMLKNSINDIATVKQKVNSLRNNVDGQVMGLRNSNQRLINAVKSLNNIQDGMNELFQTVDQSAHSYEMAENKLVGDETTENLKNPFNVQGALLSGSISGAGSILGIDYGGKAEGELIGGSVKTSGKAEFDLKKGNAEIKGEIEAKGHLAQGKLSGNFGLAEGSLEAKVGSASVEGAIGATMFSNGKFAPSLMAKLEAEAVALEGEANLQVGNDDFNAHGKATGTLFGAKAEANGGIGIITIKDKNGKEKATVGIAGEVGAEAYMAQGKVSGGITLFGIMIDLEASGKAGGAGVNAGGNITAGGVSGSIGAGLGLGAGLEINIDWTNFEL